MKLSDLIGADHVRRDINASSKKAVLEILADTLAGDIAAITSRDVFDCLLIREKLGSTGLGHGVAIPHGRIKMIEKPVCVLLLLDTPVDFDSVDKQPVDIVIGLIVPEESTEEHLQILAGIAERFSDPGFADTMRNTQTAEQLLELIRG